MQQNGWIFKLTENLKVSLGSSQAASQPQKGVIDSGFLLIKMLFAFDKQWQRESQFSTTDCHWVYERSISVGSSSGVPGQHKINTTIWGKFCFVLLCIRILVLVEFCFYLSIVLIFIFCIRF